MLWLVSSEYWLTFRKRLCNTRVEGPEREWDTHTHRCTLLLSLMCSWWHTPSLALFINPVPVSYRAVLRPPLCSRADCAADQWWCRECTLADRLAARHTQRDTGTSGSGEPRWDSLSCCPTLPEHEIYMKNPILNTFIRFYCICLGLLVVHCIIIIIV